MNGLSWFFVLWFFSPLITAAIWGQKGGSSGIGCLMGLLGPFGILLAAVGTPSPIQRAEVLAAKGLGGGGNGRPGVPKAQARECPWCKSDIRADASVCPHCQRESEAWVFNDGAWWAKTSTGEWRYLRGNQWITPEQPTNPET